MKDSSGKKLGNIGEEAAAEFLSEKGFEILSRNYRYGRNGEIDIVARKDSLLIFAEVKTRHSNTFGGPLYSLTISKRGRMKKTALSYIKDMPVGKDTIIRFDLISVNETGITWIEDILR